MLVEEEKGEAKGEGKGKRWKGEKRKKKEKRRKKRRKGGFSFEGGKGKKPQNISWDDNGES